jgi:hypothetical protein
VINAIDLDVNAPPTAPVLPRMTRPVISVDLGRLNQVIDIDEDSGLARIQAGAQGPDLEEQMGARGWVLGHYPDSCTHSTLGGWVATRSSGMKSDKYGDISDIARVCESSCRARCCSFGRCRPPQRVRAYARWCSAPRAGWA